MLGFTSLWKQPTLNKDDFVPSTELVKLFHAGARETLKECVKKGRLSLTLGVSPYKLLSSRHAAHTISERVVDVLTSSDAFDGVDDLTLGMEIPLNSNGVISQHLQKSMLDTLPIKDCDGSRFCQQLLSEVASYIKNGGGIETNSTRIAVRPDGVLVNVITKSLGSRVYTPSEAPWPPTIIL